MTKLEHAIQLAQQGFHVFPIKPGEKKPPLIKDFPNRATRAIGQIADWWAKWPEANIGISTTKYSDDQALLVVDVDNKEGKNGDAELLHLELQGFELPDTFSQQTPTGGKHLIYRVRSGVKQGADKLGTGVDIRSIGGYIVGSGSIVEAGAYRSDAGVIKDAPEWLVERLSAPMEKPKSRDSQPPSGIDHERAISRAREYLKALPSAVEGQSGDETTYKAAAAVKDFGCTEEETLRLLLEWNKNCLPPWEEEDLRTKVRNAYSYGISSPGISAPEVQFSDPFTEEAQPPTKDGIEEINDDHAYIAELDHIIWEKPAYIIHQSVVAFNHYYANKKSEGKPMAKIWMESPKRRTYHKIVFEPGLECDPLHYNLWRGFSVKPKEKNGSEPNSHPAVAAFLEHAKSNICRGDDTLFRWLVGYFAHLIQRPWEKPLVAVVFKGRKGVGKNAFVERVGALLGPHFLLTSNSRYLLSHFNGYLENCLLFTLDEAFWSGDKPAEGILKDLITGKEHNIEHKGKEPYKVANKTRIVIIGNEEWVIPASNDERRFAVFDVGDGRKQDLEFFQRMRQGLEADGYGSLLRFLLDFDITGLDFNKAPSTAALTEQKYHSMSPLHQWWLECLENKSIIGYEFAGWPETIDCERFRAAFRRYAKERSIRSRLPEDRVIGRQMKDCVPGLLKKRHSRTEDGSQPYIYQVPTIEEARADWAKFINQEVKWED